MQKNGETSKQDAIVSALRGAVARGELEAGARLPIRTELETRFGVSRMTVQKALDRLARDGFTQARGKLGTFITDYPPCLCRYGIVFADNPQDPSWGGYHEALRQVGHDFHSSEEREVAFYFSVNHEGDGDYRELLSDIQSERLAGILFASGPWHTHRTPIVQQDRVPCMAVMSPDRGTSMRHLATVQLDGESLFGAAIRTLVERGCRRPAVLIGKGYNQQLQHLRRALAAHDLPYDPAMLQGVELEHPELARHVTTLWGRLPEGERPDGIFVADDNLVETACSGLLEAGVRPGVDLPVAVHCNFPTRAAGSMPLARVGYDIRALVRHFIEVTDACRLGKRFESALRLRAVCEESVENVTESPAPELAFAG